MRLTLSDLILNRRSGIQLGALGTSHKLVSHYCIYFSFYGRAGKPGGRVCEDKRLVTIWTGAFAFLRNCLSAAENPCWDSRTIQERIVQLDRLKMRESAWGVTDLRIRGLLTVQRAERGVPFVG
jgi:hypothetical protein